MSLHESMALRSRPLGRALPLVTLASTACVVGLASSSAAAPIVLVHSNQSSTVQGSTFATNSGPNFSGTVDVGAGSFSVHSNSTGFVTSLTDVGMTTLVLTNTTGSSITLAAGSLIAHVEGSYALDPCAGCGITNNNRTVVRGNASLTVRVQNPGQFAVDHTAIGQHELSRFWNASGGVTSETNSFTPTGSGGGSVVVTSATFDELILNLVMPSIVLDPGGMLTLQSVSFGADSSGGIATFSSMTAKLALSLPAGVTLTNDSGVPLAWITVPEPSAALLLGAAGALGLARSRHQRAVGRRMRAARQSSVI